MFVTELVLSWQGLHKALNTYSYYFSLRLAAYFSIVGGVLSTLLLEMRSFCELI